MHKLHHVLSFYLTLLSILPFVRTVVGASDVALPPTALGYWLIALMAGVPLILVIFNIMIIRYYNDKGDDWKAYFPKTVAVIALTLMEATVFLLPLDVANGGGAVGCGAWLDKTNLCGNLDLGTLWQVLMVIVIVFCVFIIPLAISYYQAYDVDMDGEESTSCGSKLCTAFKWQLLTFAILTPVLFIMYAFLNKTSIPIWQNEEVDVAKFHYKPYTLEEGMLITKDWKVSGGKFYATVLKMPTSFPIYLVAAFSFLGWIFFAMYAGIGLIAIPMDLILAWKYRPKPIKQVSFIKLLNEMGNRASNLFQLGQHIKKEYRAKSDAERKKAKTADKAS